MTKMALITALVLVTIGLPACAATGSQMRGGPKIGFTMSTWWGDDVDAFGDSLALMMNATEGYSGWTFSSASRYGITIGGFARYDLSPRFSIQPEFLYSFKGTKYEGSGYYDSYPIDVTSTFKTNYLEVPVLGVLSTADARHGGFDLLLGPYLAVKVSSKLSTKVDAFGQSNEQENELEDVTAYDVGLILGAGFHTAVGFMMDARYGLGLVKVPDEGKGPDLKNQGFSLSAGLRF
jgi:hypothetical protein